MLKIKMDLDRLGRQAPDPDGSQTTSSLASIQQNEILI